MCVCLCERLGGWGWERERVAYLSGSSTYEFLGLSGLARVGGCLLRLGLRFHGRSQVSVVYSAPPTPIVFWFFGMLAVLISIAFWFGLFVGRKNVSPAWMSTTSSSPASHNGLVFFQACENHLGCRYFFPSSVFKNNRPWLLGGPRRGAFFSCAPGNWVVSSS